MLPSGSLPLLLPILIPAFGGIYILMMVAVLRDSSPRWPPLHTLLLLALSAVSAVSLLARGTRQELLFGAVLIDPRALAFHLIFLLVAALTVMGSAEHLRAAKSVHGEFYALILFAVSGMTLMAASDNLLSIFMGIEILSIALYVLAGFTRDQVYAIEGALKYFLLGAFSTGFILYGIALLYGVTGSIDLRGIASALRDAGGGRTDPLFLAGLALVLIGLAFKVAAVPFHFWAPDVYQGSMAPVSGFMAAGTKAAAFAALLRVLSVGFDAPAVKIRWVAILGALSLLSMIGGNVIALAQTNIKRMLAYSSIANAGYLMLAVAAGGNDAAGIGVVYFYLAAYALMTVGAFIVAAMVGRAVEEGDGYALEAYAGLSRRRPLLAAAMAIFMLSLTGIPPTAGFIGKFYIFKSAVNAGMYGLAATGLVASVVGAFFYLKVVVQMYLREPGASPAPAAPTSLEILALGVAAGGTIYLGFFPTALLDLARSLA